MNVIEIASNGCDIVVGHVMGNAYDLFEQNKNGEPIWVETVISLDNLKKRLMKLSALKPCKYMVYDPTEGKFIEPFKKSAQLFKESV